MTNIITTGLFPKKMWPGVKIFTNEALQDIPLEYDKLFEVIKSDKRWEEIVSTIPMSLPTVKQEGDAVQYGSFRQGLTTRLDNVVYATGFIMTHEVGVDDQYDTKLAMMGSRFMARVMRANKEIVCANVFNNGFSSFTIGDGNSFFNASHAYAGVTFSNLSTAAVLSEASVEQMMIDIGNQVDDAGIRLMQMPESIHVPLALKYTAKRILGVPREQRPSTADRDISALVAYGEDIEIHTHRYFTSSLAYFIKTSHPDGAILFEREAITGGEDNDFDTGNRKFKITDRFVPGVGDPRQWQGNAG